MPFLSCFLHLRGSRDGEDIVSALESMAGYHVWFYGGRVIATIGEVMHSFAGSLFTMFAAAP